MMRINLGAGEEILDDYVNVDHLALPGIDVVHNLIFTPWPFEDGCAEEIRAADLLEHLPNYSPAWTPMVVTFIDECHRILAPGGLLWMRTPRFDAEFLHIDPTHVRGFHERSMDFWDPDTDFGQRTGFYSESRFKVTATVQENKNLTFEMVKR